MGRNEVENFFPDRFEVKLAGQWVKKYNEKKVKKIKESVRHGK